MSGGDRGYWHKHAKKYGILATSRDERPSKTMLSLEQLAFVILPPILLVVGGTIAVFRAPAPWMRGGILHLAAGLVFGIVAGYWHKHGKNYDRSTSLLGRPIPRMVELAGARSLKEAI